MGIRLGTVGRGECAKAFSRNIGVALRVLMARWPFMTVGTDSLRDCVVWANNVVGETALIITVSLLFLVTMIADLL